LKKPVSLPKVRNNRDISTSRVLIYDGGLPGVNDEVMKGRAIVI